MQARLLERLLTAVEDDPRWEWMELSCSVAQGRADALSDLDLGLGYRDGDVPGIDEVTRMLTAVGDVIEVADQPWGAHHRWWVQYVDGGQIDLVVMAADVRPGRAPHSVALLDRDGRLETAFTPRAWSASPEQPRRWLLDGWEALANATKYLHRGSLLEACEQLSIVRERIFQLWAVGEGVAYPSFGLTSLLDSPGAVLPARIESAYPTPVYASVRAVCRAAAELLREAGQHAHPGLDTALRGYLVGRLQALAP